ncbi:MAG: amidohydrolase family protein, partial [Acidimicrobiia bacterium]
MTTIDIHSHLATPASRSTVEPHRRPEYEPYDYYMGNDSVEHNTGMVESILPALTEPAARIEHMDRMGIDIQGLSTFVSEYFYWAPPRVAAESARIQNDNLAAAAATHPDRFAPLGATVPLQDV